MGRRSGHNGTGVFLTLKIFLLRLTVGSANTRYCPSLGGLAKEIVQRISGDSLPKEDLNDPQDPKTVEHLYVVAKVMENWAKRIKEKAVTMAKEGVEFETLKLKSMGATRKCTDNLKLVEIAKEHDLSEHDLLNIINIPLKK